MKKLFLIVVLALSYMGLSAQSVDDWFPNRTKVNFKDSTNFAKTPLINNGVDTAATLRDVRAVGGGSIDMSLVRVEIGDSINALRPFIIYVADTSSMLAPYVRKVEVTAITDLKLNVADTTNMLSKYIRIADTLDMLDPYLLEIDAADTYAPLSSPNLVGIPTAPTAAPGTNTTQIATTAYVIANRGEKINVIDYGADPTGTDYSDAAFSSAVALMTDRSYLYVPPGLYKLSEKITIENLNYICIDVNGRLQFDANDSAFVFKNLRYAIIDINSMRGYGWMEVPDYSVRTSVAVTIYDCSNSEFNINHIYGFGKGIEIYSDRSGGIGNQYNRITFNYIGYCRYGIYFDGIAPYGYNNENVITGGQITGNAGLVMDGSTAWAWQNELHNIGFERLDSSGLILRSVRDLQVHNCRWENIADIFIDEDENCDYNRYYFGQTMYHSDLAYMHGRRSRIYGDILDDDGNDIYREMMKDSRDSAYYWTPRVADVRMLNRTVKFADDFDSTPDYLFEAKINGEVKRYGRREDAPVDLGAENLTTTGTGTVGILKVGDATSSTILSLDSLSTDGTTYSLYDGATQLAPNIPASGAGELGDYAKLLVDTIGIYSFGAGSGADADSTLFEINDNEFGAYYNYTDTLYVVNFKNIKISANDSLKFNCYYGNYMTGAAVDSLFNAPEPVGDNQGILTPDNFKIPPDSDVWIGISGAQITGKRPKEWILQMNGYLIRDH